MLSFTPAPENRWLLQVPAAELDATLNGALALVSQWRRQLPPPAPAMSGEQARAFEKVSSDFQRVFDMLNVGLPAVQAAQHASSCKGRAAELSLDDALAEAFAAYRLRDTSATPHSGDRVLETPHGDVLIEYKDYRGAVPTREVAKFERDAQQSGAGVGVLCAFGTHVARKPRRISIETCGGCTLVFVPHADRAGEKLLMALEFAVWQLRHARAGGDAARMLRAAEACVASVEATQRELLAATEALARQTERLTEIRVSHLAALRARLAELTRTG